MSSVDTELESDVRCKGPGESAFCVHSAVNIFVEESEGEVVQTELVGAEATFDDDSVCPRVGDVRVLLDA